MAMAFRLSRRLRITRRRWRAPSSPGTSSRRSGAVFREISLVQSDHGGADEDRRRVRNEALRGSSPGRCSIPGWWACFLPVSSPGKALRAPSFVSARRSPASTISSVVSQGALATTRKQLPGRPDSRARTHRLSGLPLPGSSGIRRGRPPPHRPNFIGTGVLSSTKRCTLDFEESMPLHALRGDRYTVCAARFSRPHIQTDDETEISNVENENRR